MNNSTPTVAQAVTVSLQELVDGEWSQGKS
jgi:hypothetical protein